MDSRLEKPNEIIDPARCRVCNVWVSKSHRYCHACGAPEPAMVEFKGLGYFYESKATWAGMPLIQIAMGMDENGKPRVAEGIIAIGQNAIGGIAIGVIARGFISFGVVSLGFFSVGVVSIALIAAAGVNAFAPVAVGVFAAGYMAGGVSAFGWKVLFSVR